MVAILSAVVSIFAFRFRSRASLEFGLIAVGHQLTVLRRQRPGRPQLSSLDRLLWVWLYRIWPQVIDAMILVKPATVVQWHRKGFRLHWRWRSRRPGRPKIGTEIRGLIRRMSRAARHGIPLALCQHLHEFRHIAVIGPFIGVEAAHRCDQVFVTEPCQPGRRRAALKIRLMAWLALGNSVGWRRRAGSCVLRRPALGREIGRDLANIFLRKRFGYGRHDRVIAIATLV